MTIDELEAVCTQAARTLAQRERRPLPAAVVLPLPEATRVTTLPDFPDDDPSRFDLLAAFAADVMRPANAPCYGFVAEAALDSEAGPVEVVTVAFGARRLRPRITAAPIGDGGLGAFLDSEELDPTAMPFLAPLQHAVDAAEPADPAGPIGIG